MGVHGYAKVVNLTACNVLTINARAEENRYKVDVRTVDQNEIINT